MPSKTPSPSPRTRLPAPTREDVRTGDSPFDRVLRHSIERRTRESTFMFRVVRPVLDMVGERADSLISHANLDAVRFRLLQAGFPKGLRARDFIVLKILGLVLVPFMMSVYIPIFGLILGMSFSKWVYIIGLVASAWLGWRVANIWLAIVTKKRQFEVQLVLPDMIDLITISVEAGLGLYAAIQRVSLRFANPLSEEFLRALQEVRLGRTNTESMRDLMRRVDHEDLTMFISSLIQAESLGVPIANVLRAQSERLRDKRRQRAREQAQKAPLKMLFPLVFFIFPALFVVILGPAIIRMMDSGL